jgi:hypothetical protein
MREVLGSKLVRVTHYLTELWRFSRVPLCKFLDCTSIQARLFRSKSPPADHLSYLQTLHGPDTESVVKYQSESESELLYDWRFTANQFILETNSLRFTTSNFFFQLNTCGHSPYVTSSLTRGWICRLQLLLVLASVVILRSEFRRTQNHISLSQTLGSPNLDGKVPVFISPRHWVPFSSHLTTRRTTVEVFEPASTRV